MPSHTIILSFILILAGTWLVMTKFRGRRAENRIQNQVDSLKSRGWDQQDVYEIRQFIEFAAKRPSKKSLGGIVALTIVVILFEIYLLLTINVAIGLPLFILEMVPVVVLLFIVRNSYKEYVRAEEIRDYLRDDPAALLNQGSEILSFLFEETVDRSDETGDWGELEIETDPAITSRIYETGHGESVYFKINEEEDYKVNTMSDQIDVETKSGDVVASIDILPSKQVENVVHDKGELRIDITEPRES